MKENKKGGKRKKKAGAVEKTTEIESDDGTSGDESPNKKSKYDSENFHATLKSEMEKTVELNQTETVEETSELVHIDSLAKDKVTCLNAVQKKINNTTKQFKKILIILY